MSQELIIDNDEIRIIPEDNQYYFIHRFANENNWITDGRKYETIKTCFVWAMVNMSLSINK